MILYREKMNGKQKTFDKNENKGLNRDEKRVGHGKLFCSIVRTSFAAQFF